MFSRVSVSLPLGLILGPWHSEKHCFNLCGDESLNTHRGGWEAWRTLAGEFRLPHLREPGAGQAAVKLSAPPPPLLDPQCCCQAPAWDPNFTDPPLPSSCFGLGGGTEADTLGQVLGGLSRGGDA